MNGTATVAGKAELGPAKFVAAMTALPNIALPDTALARLFTLPDTRAALEIFGGCRLQGASDAALASCREAHLVAALWYGTVRPGAVAAVAAISQYATLASAACGTLNDLLSKEDTNAAIAQQAVALIESLKAPALAQSQTWANLAQQMIGIEDRLQVVIPQILTLDQQHNLWDLDPYESQGLMEKMLKESTSAICQQLQGAWGAFSDDAAAIANTLSQDVEAAPAVIAQLGVQEAENAWTQVAANAMRTLPANPMFSSQLVTTQVGWFRLEDSNDMNLDLGLQAGPGNSVGLGPGAGADVQMERLVGDQCGYFKLKLINTGKYLAGSGSNTLVQSDWSDADSQKWRPFLAGQHRLGKGLVEGYFLIQRTTGLFASANSATVVPPVLTGGKLVGLVQQAGAGQPGGLAVFQIPSLPYGS